MGLKQEIEITISPNGDVQLHVQGVSGAKCLALTQDLQEILGVVIKSEKTSEYYKKEEQAGIEIMNQEETDV